MNQNLLQNPFQQIFPSIFAQQLFFQLQDQAHTFHSNSLTYPHNPQHLQVVHPQQ